MTRDRSSDRSTHSSRGGRLALTAFCAPLLGGASFVVIGFLCDLLGAPLYSGSWGRLSWGASELLASFMLILIVAVFEALRLGSVRSYTIAGALGGVAIYCLSDWGSVARLGWILPLHYGLVGWALGWFAFHDFNRPRRAVGSARKAEAVATEPN